MLVFNETYYLAQNPDVAAAISANLIADAETHFVQHGYSEGRDPNPYFDISYYLQQNTDVATAGINPLAHYNTFGEDEGRGPNAIFNPTYYASQNPDVVSAGVDLLEHFINHGAAEGRFPNATTASELASGFDETAYLAANPDVAEAVSIGTFSSGYQHWSLHGFAEGRTGAQNSSGEALSVPSTGSSGPLSGFVIDGKVSGATVGIDLDGDGVIGPNEPTVTTDALGEFVFPDGTPVGPIIATGGTDISTGLPFDGKLEAPAGSTVVNPLTTVIKKIADANTDPTKSETEKVADAQTQLKSLLGLSDINADITQVDFVTEATEGDSSGADDAVSDSDGARLYSASIQLLNIVDQGAAAISGADGSVAPEDASAAMFASLAEKLASTPDGQTVDLGSTAGSDGDASNDTGDLLIDVIKGAAANTLSGDAITKVDQIADSAAAIAAAANKEISERIDALDPNAAGSAIESTLIEVVKTQKVVQGSAADNIKAAAGSDNPDAAAKTISDSIAAADGSGFVSDDIIDEQTVGDIDGDGTDDDVPAPTPTPGPTTPPPTGTTFNVINGTDDGETIDGTDGNDEINAFGGDDIINPGAGRDNVFAGAGDDQITVDKAGGSKHITGGEGDDDIIRTEDATSLLRLRYDKEAGGNGIIFSLVSATEATVIDTFGDTDTITYFGPTDISFGHEIKVNGTSQDDVFYGHTGVGIDPSFDGEDEFYAGFNAQPMGGNDQIFGNVLEFDTIDYSEEAAGITRTTGITVTWGASGGTINDGLGGTDTFDQNIDQIEGSQLDDDFTSEAAADRARFRGLDGEDTFNGGGTNDIVDYRGDDDWGGLGGIFVDLAAGTATDGFGNTDTLIDIERARGSDIDGVTDVLLGSGENNRLRGYDGDDELDGRGGNDILNGGNGNDTINGGTGNDTITGDDGDDIINGGTGFDFIVGGSGNDTITATSGFNQVIGGAGDDSVTGSTVGGSGVQMNYSTEGGGQGITVTFTADLNATVNDTFGDTDTLTDVFNYQTTTESDSITGPNGLAVTDRSFWIEMVAGGDDTINITSHNVSLSYAQYWHADLATPTQGIVVNLATLDAQGFSTITDTQGDSDSVFYKGNGDLGGVSYITGSELDDDMTGGDGDDTFVGNDGADTLDGGSGWDTVNYGALEFVNGNNGFAGVTVNLTNGTATDAFGKSDTLSNIEQVNGSSGSDDLTGDGENNNLNGNGGDDLLDGAGGDDFLMGGEGDDQITTGAGEDRVYYFSIQAHGEDTITDFTLNEDKILFDTIAQSDVDNFQLTLVNSDQDTLIDFGMVNDIDLGQVTLTGVNTGTLDDIVDVWNPL